MRRIKPFPPVLKPFTKPDVTPYCGILLMILLIFLGYPFGASFFSCLPLDTGELHYPDLIPIYSPYIPMGIDENGSLLFNCSRIDDLEKLPLLIEAYSEEKKIYSNIIQLFIHKDVQFGRVLEVFRGLKKAGCDRIVLSPRGYVSTIDIMRIEKAKSLLRSKNE